MKIQILKLIALIALLTAGGFSCEDDRSSFHDDKFQLKNPGKKTSSFSIDSNIISFAVPYIAHIRLHEHLPEPNYGGPNAWGPHFWTITLFMTKGTDVSKLAPIITLAPGASITPTSGTVHDFSKQVSWTVIAPDGSTVNYYSLATADW